MQEKLEKYFSCSTSDFLPQRLDQNHGMKYFGLDHLVLGITFLETE